jgi:hypothetical protein
MECETLNFDELVHFSYTWPEVASLLLKQQQTPWLLVRKRTIPTGDRHLSTKFSVNFVDRGVSRGR